MNPILPNSSTIGPLACHNTVPTGMGSSPSLGAHGHILDSIGLSTGFRADRLGVVRDPNGFLTGYVIKERKMYDSIKNPLLI